MRNKYCFSSEKNLDSKSASCICGFRSSLKNTWLQICQMFQNHISHSSSNCTYLFCLLKSCQEITTVPAVLAHLCNITTLKKMNTTAFEQLKLNSIRVRIHSLPILMSIKKQLRYFLLLLPQSTPIRFCCSQSN